MRFFRQLRVPTAATYFWAFSQIALMAFVLLQRSTEVQSKGRDFRSVPDRYFRQICRPVVSAMIGFSILQSTPAIPQAHASDSLANIARASETVDFLLDNLENKDQDMKRLFDRVDFIIKQFSLRERLQLALAESPAEYRSCAEPKAKNILDDLSTLVEYYSVSNDSMDRRMMISEAVPGEKLKFAKIGLSAVKQDMRNFFFCFPSEYKKFN